jgi:DNA-binding transcriptional ArsR family regulator
METIKNKEIKKISMNANSKDNDNENENYNAVEVKYIIEALEALSNESRLKIFRMLVKAGYSGLTVTEMSKRLNMPMSTLSFHLAKLSQANIVLFVKQSRFIIYSANFESVNKLISYLTESCCNGNPKECFNDICKK